MKELWSKFLGLIGTHKVASIVTASVVGVAAIGGGTVGIVHAVNSNNADEEEVEEKEVDLVADNLAGQEFNLADLNQADVVEEVQADGTTAIKDKSGKVIAKKDQSGKTTLTSEGAKAIASNELASSGNLANSVSQAQTYVASTNTGSSNNYSAPVSNNQSNNNSAPAQSTQPVNNNSAQSVPQGCLHNWQTVPTTYKTVHHDAVTATTRLPVYVSHDYTVCDTCGAKFEWTADQANIGNHVTQQHGGGYWTTYSENVFDHYETTTEVMIPAYDEQVVDQYDYNYCTKCGESR